MGRMATAFFPCYYKKNLCVFYVLEYLYDMNVLEVRAYMLLCNISLQLYIIVKCESPFKYMGLHLANEE